MGLRQAPYICSGLKWKIHGSPNLRGFDSINPVWPSETILQVMLTKELRSPASSSTLCNNNFICRIYESALPFGPPVDEDFERFLRLLTSAVRAGRLYAGIRRTPGVLLG